MIRLQLTQTLTSSFEMLYSEEFKSVYILIHLPTTDVMVVRLVSEPRNSLRLSFSEAVVSHFGFPTQDLVPVTTLVPFDGSNADLIKFSALYVKRKLDDWLAKEAHVSTKLSYAEVASVLARLFGTLDSSTEKRIHYLFSDYYDLVGCPVKISRVTWFSRLRDWLCSPSCY